MSSAKYVRIVKGGADRAEQKLESWATRGLSDAIKQGMDEYGFRLGEAAYRNMKLPTVGPNGPLYVGLSWKRSKQFHERPRPTGRQAEWQIRVKPSYLALWQEHGIKPHDVFNPDKQRAQAFRRIARRQTRIRDRKTALQNISPNLRTKAERAKLSREKYNEKKSQQQLDDLKAARGSNAVMGYSEPSWIPKKNYKTDWFDKNTPKATTGARSGQTRPVQVRSGSKISTKKGVLATRPIYRGAIQIAGRHRERMSQLLAQAYEKRS